MVLEEKSRGNQLKEGLREEVSLKPEGDRPEGARLGERQENPNWDASEADSKG